MLVNTERTQLRQLLQDPRWKAVEHLVEELCDKVRSTSGVRDTEWETVSLLLMNEGEVKGMRHLIQEIYAQATHESS